MLGQRELTVEDYLGMLRRRFWWLIIPAILCPAIAFGVSLILPSRYTSQTLVLVEQQKVPDSLVRPVITEVLDERLATMKEQILSRTRLQPIIEMFGLFEDRKKLSMEDKVDLMRKVILISPVRADFGGGRSGLPGFYISFTAPNGKLAQQVCGEITSMFLAENLKVREQRAQGTTDFIGRQLEDSKQKLDEQDSKLAEFKRKYIGQLPGQEQTNLNMLNSLNTQLEANTQGLNQLEQSRTYTESVLGQQVQAWHALQDNKTETASPETLDQQLAAEQAQLTVLQSKYTETHPDVVRLKEDIERLKERIAQQGTAAPTKPVSTEKKGGPESAQIQQLRLQLKGIEQSIRNKQSDQGRIQAQINTYQARIQLSPVVEEQYKQLTRDYDTALRFYNDLLQKQNESEMATDLERRQQGEQFRVLDPPNVPEKPIFPNRPMFAAGGLGIGLALGLGLVFMLEFKDKIIRNEKDVAFYLELPILARVPSLEHARAKKNQASKQRKSDAIRIA